MFHSRLGVFALTNLTMDCSLNGFYIRVCFGCIGSFVGRWFSWRWFVCEALAFVDVVCGGYFGEVGRCETSEFLNVGCEPFWRQKWGCSEGCEFFA